MDLDEAKDRLRRKLPGGVAVTDITTVKGEVRLQAAVHFGRHNSLTAVFDLSELADDGGSVLKLDTRLGEFRKQMRAMAGR